MDKKALAEKLAGHVRKGGIVVIAHSSSQTTINGRYKGGMASMLSKPLDTAQNEAEHFLLFFRPERLVDNDEMFFVRLLRA